MAYLPASGFIARGDAGPRRDNPRDWLVWHFTHKLNLGAICASGKLLPASSVEPPRNVANQDVKGRRSMPVRPDTEYPPSSVHDHVPFYIAAKSPMLFVVTQSGKESYRARSADLVFMGAVLGDLIDARVTWCVSDGNAAAGYTQFTRVVDDLSGFVDFDLLCQRMWRNTAEDPHRQGRRAAECLVLGEVPLELIRVVVTRNESDLDFVRAAFSSVGGERQYFAKQDIFYN